MKRAESFDVFDTVLTRAVGDPRAVFLLCGKSLASRQLISIPPAEFATRRVEAEAQARLRGARKEIALEAIYAELARTLSLPKTSVGEAMLVECELEDSLIRPVPGADQKVSAARERHGMVIFVSDMYLPRALIIRWLERYGLWQPSDRLYLSNEEGLSKATGELFRRVLEQERLRPEELTHHGNNPHDDVASARRRGVQTQPFPEGNLQRYEELLVGVSSETKGLSALLAGSSRLARLAIPARDKTEEALRDVSASVIAPILTAYVLWLLRRAEELGLRRLYFVSRDGQILLEIARRLAPKLKSDCELRYLYSSRQSWHLPTITNLGQDEMDWIFRQYDFLSIESVLFRVGLLPQEIAEELFAEAFSPNDWKRQLGFDEIARLKSVILHQRVSELILAKATAAREALIGYFRQEGLFDTNAWALVDVGWNGRPQASLGRLLRDISASKPRGFYFGLDTRPDGECAGMFDAYMFDQVDGTFRDALSGVNVYVALEIACSGIHGTVDGFVRNPSGYAPLLRMECNQPAVDWGLPLMQRTVCQFADYLALNINLWDHSVDLRSTLVKLLREFWERPTFAEVSAWGRFVMERDQSGPATREIAKGITLGDLWRTLRTRKAFGLHTLWLQGSIARSPLPVRLLLGPLTRSGIPRELRKLMRR